MNRILALILAMLMIIGVITSCTEKNKEENSTYVPKVESTAGLKFMLNDDKKSYTLVNKGTCTASEIVIDGHNGLPVTSIHREAFKNCTGLTSVTIGSSVTSIGEWAFYDCTELTNITIPDSITNIEALAFENTGYYNNESNWKNGVLYIGRYLISAKPDISGTYNIKAGTKAIVCFAFQGCEELSRITIPNSVTSIGYRAFYGCAKLSQITIPNNVTSIGHNVFNGTVYYNDESNWKNGVLYIGKYLINAKMDISGAYNIKSGTTVISDSAFRNCRNLTSITISDSVTSIGESAFFECTGLTNVIVGKNVINIGKSAFAGCTSLTSVTIPDNVTNIKSYAFAACNSLTSVTIPDNVTNIESYAFAACNSLTSVTIPDNVTNIGSNAFSACNSLTSINYRGTEEQWNAISKSDAKIPTSCEIIYNYTGE